MISLSERPTRMGPGKIDPIIDFWVRRAAGEEFLLVPHGAVDIPLPSKFNEVPIRTINAVDRAASSVWTSNWMRMLPVINAARNAISKTTMKSVSRFVREPMPLAMIERQFGNGDPTAVRATIFELLRIGQAFIMLENVREILTPEGSTSLGYLISVNGMHGQLAPLADIYEVWPVNPDGSVSAEQHRKQIMAVKSYNARMLSIRKQVKGALTAAQLDRMYPLWSEEPMDQKKKKRGFRF